MPIAARKAVLLPSSLVMGMILSFWVMAAAQETNRVEIAVDVKTEALNTRPVAHNWLS